MIDLSQELHSTLADLAGTFRRVEENPESFGTGKAIIRGCFQEADNGWVNVIPGGDPGQCRRTLVVAIGSNESGQVLTNRLLEAVEHVAVKCKGTTALVVFYAMWWDAKEWSRRRGTFQQLSVPCVLVMPFLEPQQLH
jgi:hypothetical protein